eukprot:1156772-Pelagomonas_calceolata.AAC.3
MAVWAAHTRHAAVLRCRAQSVSRNRDARLLAMALLGWAGITQDALVARGKMHRMRRVCDARLQVWIGLGMAPFWMVCPLRSNFFCCGVTECERATQQRYASAYEQCFFGVFTIFEQEHVVCVDGCSMGPLCGPHWTVMRYRSMNSTCIMQGFALVILRAALQEWARATRSCVMGRKLLAMWAAEYTQESPQGVCARTHTRAHKHTHTHTQAHTHNHTHTYTHTHTGLAEPRGAQLAGAKTGSSISQGSRGCCVQAQASTHAYTNDDSMASTGQGTGPCPRDGGTGLKVGIEWVFIPVSAAFVSAAVVAFVGGPVSVHLYKRQMRTCVCVVCLFTLNFELTITGIDAVRGGPVSVHLYKRQMRTRAVVVRQRSSSCYSE